MYSASINPNFSSTNLLHINGDHKKEDIKRPQFQQQFSFPSTFTLTPPLSKVSSPVHERSSPFSTKNASWFQLVKARIAWSDFDPRVAGLCFLWYVVSIFSSNSTKMILLQFSHPVTLTECQFLLNIVLSLVLLKLLMVFDAAKAFPPGCIPPLNGSLFKIVSPTPLILSTTVPMGVFQFMGQLTSHKATSLVPVSLVHTIKALSPIVTVAIFRLFFGVRYKSISYISLIPLVAGVILACYRPKHSDSQLHYGSGLFYALVSMLIFVSQNIFAKARLTYNSDALPLNKTKKDKVDKLTILLYCSLVGFVLTLPIYAYLEFRNTRISVFDITTKVAVLIVLNGVSHFAQTFTAFQILGLMSPVNYTIASIMKRIFIIVIAYLWESKSISPRQIIGLCLTIGGLYCYEIWGGEKRPHSKSN